MNIDQVALLPAYCAAGTAVLALLADLLVARRTVTVAATAFGAVLTGAAAVLVGRGGSRVTFCVPEAGCSYHVDGRSALLALLFVVLTLGVLGLSAPHLAPARRTGDEPALPAGEYCFLLACSMTGGVVLASAGDLLTLIIALETLTLPLYALVGLRRTRLESASGALTFFLVSVVATAVTLLGAGLHYAATGNLYLTGSGPLDLGGPGPVAPALAPIATVSVVLLLGGLAFKVAAVPLHAWAPATYDGAPVPIAGYLSTASKLGGVVAIVAVLDGLFPGQLDVAGPVLAVLAVLTMTVGNLGALRQRRMVRLLAWSSVAQAGYILAPLGGYAALHPTGGGPAESIAQSSAVPEVAALAYTVFYVLLELVAFAGVVALRGRADGGLIEEYRGAARRSPWPAGALVLALVGLAGLPPGLAGLFAKLVVVRSLLVFHGWWLALIVAVNAVIGLAYYAPVVATLLAAPAQRPAGYTPPRSALPVTVVLTAATLVVIVLGFAPALIFPALTR